MWLPICQSSVPRGFPNWLLMSERSASMEDPLNAVSPGWIATEMTALEQPNDDFNRYIRQRAPLAGWGTIKEVRRHRRLPGLRRLHLHHRHRNPHRPRGCLGPKLDRNPRIRSQDAASIQTTHVPVE